MTRAVLASIVSCALVSTAGAQARPDFSGTWRFDPTRSESATYPELSRPLTMAIVQTPDDVRIETTTGRGTTTEVARFTSKDVVPVSGAATARWRGSTLVIDAIRQVRGQSVTAQQALTLNADASELVVESTVNVQHGYSISGAKVYGAGKDVFVRVR
jgi:hypothetical protein